MKLQAYAWSFHYFRNWWSRLDLNQRHRALQAPALPTELQDRVRRKNFRKLAFEIISTSEVLGASATKTNEYFHSTTKNDKIKDMKKINTAPISGFSEFLPARQALYDDIKTKIAQTFRAHGFQHIETPTIERAEVLFAKSGGETEKQIYQVLKPQDPNQKLDQALRFDHTVPLARYVVEHESALSFPLRVTQIGKSFRGERAQKGRFREFCQCDLDVLGRGSLPSAYDSDVIFTLISALKAFMPAPFTFRISDRRILNGLIKILGLEEKSHDIFSIIDHAEKVTPEKTAQSFDEIGLTPAERETLETFLNIHGPRETVLADLEALLEKLESASPETETAVEFRSGLDSLSETLAALESLGCADYVKADMRIVRGLDYYTGAVFECVVRGQESLGSICSGGRYENLAAAYSDQKFPGVGGSIGLTRLFYLLESNGLLDEIDAKKPIDYVILPILTTSATTETSTAATTLAESAELSFAHSVAAKLRKTGAVVDLDLSDKRLGDRLNRAGKIAHSAIVIGSTEAETKTYKIRNLATGAEETASM